MNSFSAGPIDEIGPDALIDEIDNANTPLIQKPGPRDASTRGATPKNWLCPAHSAFGFASAKFQDSFQFPIMFDPYFKAWYGTHMLRTGLCGFLRCGVLRRMRHPSGPGFAAGPRADNNMFFFLKKRSRLLVTMPQQPYWANPGQAPPAHNPNSDMPPNYAGRAYSQGAPLQPQIPMAQPVSNSEIPMAQAMPYGQNVPYRYGNNVMPPGYPAQLPPGYPAQQIPYGPNGMMGYAGNAERVTVTQPYCGPITCMIGMVLCFFTGFGFVVACCPCDTETVTYVNGARADY
jgi:hypothetical protein